MRLNMDMWGKREGDEHEPAGGGEETSQMYAGF